MDSQQILKILQDALELAEEVEANVGIAPTAQEALCGVIDQIALLSTAQVLVT